MRQDHADAVGFRQLDKHPTGPLPWKDQLRETLAAHQSFGAVFFRADKLGARSTGLGLGITGHVQARGVLGYLGADFTFEAWPAMHKEDVH
ncbi:hypothetical protein D3C78_1107140 [compost metagenome]